MKNLYFALMLIFFLHSNVSATIIEAGVRCQSTVNYDFRSDYAFNEGGDAPNVSCLSQAQNSGAESTAYADANYFLGGIRIGAYTTGSQQSEQPSPTGSNASAYLTISGSFRITPVDPKFAGSKVNAQFLMYSYFDSFFQPVLGMQSATYGAILQIGDGNYFYFSSHNYFESWDLSTSAVQHVKNYISDKDFHIVPFDNLIELDHELIAGKSYDMLISVSGIASSSVSGNYMGGDFATTLDANHSLYWGGVTVTADGTPIAFTVDSTMDFDLKRSYLPPLSSIPEPSSIWLLLTGILCIGIIARPSCARIKPVVYVVLGESR